MKAWAIVGLMLCGCGGGEAFGSEPMLLAPDSGPEEPGADARVEALPDAPDAPGANLDAAADVVVDTGADVWPEPALEAGCQTCYRNMAMDPHCTEGMYVVAWVCPACLPANCIRSYDAQESLACCRP